MLGLQRKSRTWLIAAMAVMLLGVQLLQYSPLHNHGREVVDCALCHLQPLGDDSEHEPQLIVPEAAPFPGGTRSGGAGREFHHRLVFLERAQHMRMKRPDRRRERRRAEALRDLARDGEAAHHVVTLEHEHAPLVFGEQRRCDEKNDAERGLEEIIVAPVLDRLEIALSRADDADVAGDAGGMRDAVAQRDVVVEVGTEPRQTERPADESETRMGGSRIGLRLHDLEAPHAFTCRVSRPGKHAS